MTIATPLKTPEFIALFSLATSLTALSIDAVLPALPVIAQDLQAAHTNDTQLVVTMFIFGMVFGELLFGPLSDAIGRKKAIMIGLLIYSIGTLLAMLAFSMQHILLGRIIQGIGVSGPKIATRAMVRDLYQGDAMARIMSFIIMIFILVPMLAPALGQAVLFVFDWRAIFVLYLIFAITVACWMGLRQPETLAPEKRIRLAPATLMVNSLRIIQHRQVMAYTLCAGFIFGAQLLYLSISQAIFTDLYDTGSYFPLYFAILALSIGIASFSNGQLVMKYGMQRLSKLALYGLLGSSSILFCVTLFYQGIPPFIVFMLLCFLMFFCFGLFMGNINAMAMQSLGNVAGIGASLVASISSLVAVAISVPIGWFYNQSVLPLVVGFMISGAASLFLLAKANRMQRYDV